MNFRNFPQIKVGIFNETFDFNLTSQCLKHGIDREMRQICKNMPSLWPNAAGALQYFPVRVKS
jgi:hypothetical protein